jgi:hypothetical protein
MGKWENEEEGKWENEEEGKWENGETRKKLGSWGALRLTLRDLYVMLLWSWGEF